MDRILNARPCMVARVENEPLFTKGLAEPSEMISAAQHAEHTFKASAPVCATCPDKVIHHHLDREYLVSSMSCRMFENRNHGYVAKCPDGKTFIVDRVNNSARELQTRESAAISPLGSACHSACDASDTLKAKSENYDVPKTSSSDCW